MEQQRRIVIGVTGGIAAYKAPLLVRLLRKESIDVRVVLTPNARPFVGEESLRTLSSNFVYADRSAGSTNSSLLYSQGLDHIRLAEWAECIAIAPATANTIAKIAHGIADNLLTTLALAIAPERLVVAPAMNSTMWNHPATRENVALLEKRGVHLLPVGSGELACGTEGPGRMLDVEDIAAYLHAFDSQRPLFEKKVLITCGATAEPIDPVRIITNRSSGRMGVALAAAAWAFGAKVTVVHGSMHARFPAAARLIPIATAQEMQRTLEKEFSECDLCVMAAAVSDFTIEQPSAGKIAREGQASLDLKLRPTPDIARSLGQRKRPGQKLVGFALESAAGEERALQKMLDKSCDLMILNHPQIALGGEVTQITILSPSRAPERLPRMDKRLAARHILIRAAELLGVE